MVSPNPAELTALQDSLYREKVHRARALNTEERFTTSISLTRGSFQRMLQGALWQLETTDEEQGWLEVRRRLELLARVNDHQRPDLAGPQSS